MYIEDKLFSEGEQEVYYSVVLDEEEMRLFSEFQKEFGVCDKVVKFVRNLKAGIIKKRRDISKNFQLKGKHTGEEAVQDWAEATKEGSVANRGGKIFKSKLKLAKGLLYDKISKIIKPVSKSSKEVTDRIESRAKDILERRKDEPFKL